jgi:hypothetical protein
MASAVVAKVTVNTMIDAAVNIKTELDSKIAVLR